MIGSETAGETRPARSDILLYAPRVKRAWRPRTRLPLAPHYLVHVSDDGAVLLSFVQAKQVLDRLKKLCTGQDVPDAGACAVSIGPPATART